MNYKISIKDILKVGTGRTLSNALDLKMVRKWTVHTKFEQVEKNKKKKTVEMVEQEQWSNCLIFTITKMVVQEKHTEKITR